MKTKLLIAVLLPLIVLSACAGGHQERVNTISYAMRDFNAAWDIADEAILDLYEKNLVGKDVREKRDAVATLHERLNENWKFVPQTDASIEAFISQQDFQSGLRLLLDLGEVLNANGTTFNFPRLPTFKRGEQ